MEKSKNPDKPRNEKEGAAKKPPGEFVNDELEEQTKRFLEEVKGRARRRRETSSEEGLGPPPAGRQRSSRR